MMPALGWWGRKAGVELGVKEGGAESREGEEEAAPRNQALQKSGGEGGRGAGAKL